MKLKIYRLFIGLTIAAGISLFFSGNSVFSGHGYVPSSPGGEIGKQLPVPEQIIPASESDHGWLEISVEGGGNALDSPVTQLKLYFDDLGEVNNQAKLIELLDIRCAGSYDYNDNCGGFAGSNDDTVISFYATDESETIVTPALQCNGYDNTLRFNGSNSASFPPASIGTYGNLDSPWAPHLLDFRCVTQNYPNVQTSKYANYKYVIIMDIRFENAGNGLGRNNIFKVRIPSTPSVPGAAVDGMVGYRAPGQVYVGDTNRISSDSVAYRSFCGGLCSGIPSGDINGPNGPYAIQGRATAPDRQTFQFRFSVPECTAQDINGNSAPFYLRWFDADSSGVSGSTPSDAGVHWVLINERTGQEVGIPAGSPALGGQSDYVEFAVTPDRFEPGDVFLWEWRDVWRLNALQMWMPFDSYSSTNEFTQNYNSFLSANPELDPQCDEEYVAPFNVQGQKVIGSGASMSVPSGNENPGNQLITLLDSDNQEATLPDHEGQPQDSSTTDQPYFFRNVPGGNQTYTVTAAEQEGFQVIGYTACNPADQSQTLGQCHQQSPTPGSTFTIDAAELEANNQDLIDLWFHYESDVEPVKYVRYHKVDMDCNLLSITDSPANDQVKYYDTIDQFNTDTPVAIRTAREGSFQLQEAPSDRMRIFPNDPDWTYEGYSRKPDSDISNDPMSACSTPGPTSGTWLSVLTSSDREYQDIYFYYQEVPEADALPEKKVYGANDVQISPNNVRDNRQLTIDVNAFFWADATHRFTSSNPSDTNPLMNQFLWTSGVYGARAGDQTSRTGSSPLNINTMETYNTVAEEGCPNNCNHLVPLAYVSQNDGSGRPVENPDGGDGATTPNGNDWLRIRQEGFGSHQTGAVTSCGTYNETWRAVCGGMASNLSEHIGGITGNYLRNVEISDIRIRARGLQVTLQDTGLQGKVDHNVIQITDVADKNLAIGSGYLPPNSQGPTPNTPTWDNIRNPASPHNPLIVLSADETQQFRNTQTGGSSDLGPFLFAPNAMTNIYDVRDEQVAQVQTASLLQDGNGVYNNGTEPLTYTAMVDWATDVELNWDEYAEWSQVDDKGHWYTTRSTPVTGVDRGAGTSDSYTLQNFDAGSSEFSHVDHSARHPCPTPTNPNRTCHSHANDTNVYTQCTGSYSYYTGITYNYNSLTYYYPNAAQTRFGWLVNTPMNSSTLNETNFTSYFGSNPASNPTWSNTSEPYWQDTSKTSMDTQGTSQAPAHNKRWIYDTTDRAYTNRDIYDQPSTPSFKTGWYYNSSTGNCKYPNGGGVSDQAAQNTDTYYPSASLLYENSSSATGHAYGRYNFADDGVKDGKLDTGWSWTSNLQRVRYENTWQNRHRDLGHRYSWRTGGRPGYTQGLSNQRPLIYGLAPQLNNSANPLASSNISASILASRGRAIIYNPLIAASNADIYAGGGLDSYFETSVAASAFVFTQSGGVSNVNNVRTFNNYFINPDVDVAARLDEDNLTGLFRNLSQLESGATAIGATISPGAAVLGNNHDRVYHRAGDLVLTAGTFGRGAKTIIVDGDLYINGNVQYSSASVTTRAQLPSVGFIVKGDVIIADNVSAVVGAFAVNKCFNIDSKLASSTENCLSYISTESTTVDDEPRFTLNGLVIADRFALLRQPRGELLQSNQYAETFQYDSRVLINTPPGFSRVFTEPQDWLEVTPRN